MPRGARLDDPGDLHHVMVRGLEQRVIFGDEDDRRDFVRRLGQGCARSGACVLAWALLPNHVHVLLRSGADGLSALMRRVLAGYAGRFNRRHRRAGHLFQNRFKSIVVEEEAYLLELVRYIHLNPVRAGVIDGISALDRYSWTGHAVLLGYRDEAWQDTATVLGQFGDTPRSARRAYRAFVIEGAGRGRRPEFAGGGLRRSQAGWQLSEGVRRGRERWSFDERVLGSSAFAECIVARCAQDGRVIPLARPEAASNVGAVMRTTAEQTGLSTAELASGSRRREVVVARAIVCTTAVKAHGLPVAVVASALGISPRSVLRAVQRRGGVGAGT